MAAFQTVESLPFDWQFQRCFSDVNVFTMFTSAAMQ